MVDLIKSPNYTLNVRLCWDGKGPSGGNVRDDEGNASDKESSVALPLCEGPNWVDEETIKWAIEHGDFHEDDKDKLAEIIIGHELGHAIFDFDDPGVVEAVENVLRDEMGKKPRRVYTGFDGISPEDSEKETANRIIDKYKDQFPGLNKVQRNLKK